jgi:hypothetical protein
MARRSKQANFVSLNLRLPPDLHKKLVKAAGPTSSLNSEIIRRLQLTYDAPEMEQLKQEILAAGTKLTNDARGMAEQQKRIIERLKEVEELLRERAGRAVPSPSNSNDL